MRALPLLVIALALVVAGCGTTTIDDAKAEKFITTTVEDQVGAEVESVECPADVEAKKGDTFDCTVNGADGTSGAAKVTQKDDKGNVNVSAPFIHIGNLENQIGGELEERAGGKVEVVCPEIVTGDKGGTFDCEATAGEETAKIKVTQTDDQGNVNYEVVQ